MNLRDRVKETTTTINNKAFVLSGNSSGFTSFSASAGQNFPSLTNGDWETGFSTYGVIPAASWEIDASGLLSNRNRTAHGTASGFVIVVPRYASAPTGKLYVEVRGLILENQVFGVSDSASGSLGLMVSYVSGVWAIKTVAGTTIGTTSATPTPSAMDVVALCIDWTGLTCSLRVNNSVVSGPGGAFSSGEIGIDLRVIATVFLQQTLTGNFDDADLVYTPPAGYSGWSTWAGKSSPGSGLFRERPLNGASGIGQYCYFSAGDKDVFIDTSAHMLNAEVGLRSTIMNGGFF
jgi:hypothetical protein